MVGEVPSRGAGRGRDQPEVSVHLQDCVIAGDICTFSASYPVSFRRIKVSTDSRLGIVHY